MGDCYQEKMRGHYMTKKELMQLRYLNKEIELLQKQIADAEYTVESYITHDIVSGSNPE